MADNTLLPQLMAILQQQQEQDAATQQLLQQPAQTGLLTPGQSVGDLLTSPTGPQNQALLQFGLSLLGSTDRDPLTKSFSDAAQSGLNILGQARGQARTQQLQAAQAQSQALQRQFGNVLGAGKLGLDLASAGREDLQFGNVDIPDGEGGFLTRIGVKDKRSGGVFTRDGTPVPEGSRFTITGRTEEDVSAAGLTTGQAGKVQDSLRTARLAIAEAADITSDKINKFMSAKGRVKATVGKGLDFLSGFGGEEATAALENLTGEDLVAFSAEARTMFEDVEQVFAKFRKEITGAQAAAIELERLKVATLNRDLPPAQAIASLQNLVQRFERQILEDERALDTGRAPTDFFTTGGAGGGTTQIGRFQVREN